MPREAGLTGRQGVLIPAENVEDLMLRDDVIEAVAAGKFHIMPVTTLEEGIEILTGRAGRAPRLQWDVRAGHRVSRWSISGCTKWPRRSSPSSRRIRKRSRGSKKQR